ncbi:MAG: ATP-binding protein, partial [Bacteroidaceae bacterium]|nr:ATP-binding protein [Bacteroidaceae bacterium]
MAKFIGRKKEAQVLTGYLNSGSPEFVVLYGRRRVGKTYLVRTLLSQYFSFSVTGLSPLEKKKNGVSDLQRQLLNFGYALKEYGYEGGNPSSWMDAFQMLKDLLSRRDKDERHVIFIDEMPWMDTPRSGFLVAFEAFWNGWASGQDNLMLVVCGSATSWIIKKIFKNKGGLFNRVTRKIYLPPFTLSECEKLIEKKNIVLSRYDILSAYMILGGVPFYWNMLQPGMSLAQNIDALFFASTNAPLRDEFDLLIKSLFSSPEPYMRIINA